MLESIIVNTDRSMDDDPKDARYEELRIILDDGRLIVATVSSTGLLAVEVSEIGEFNVNTKMRSVSTEYTYAIVSERG